jgi:hypothetical protein
LDADLGESEDAGGPDALDDADAPAGDPESSRVDEGSPDARLRHPDRTPQRFAREAAKGLRQKAEPSTSTSWWLGKSREELAKEADERSISMSASKVATKVRSSARE